MTERKAIIVHYRTEEAKAYRRQHGDRGGVPVRRQIPPYEHPSLEQHNKHSNER